MQNYAAVFLLLGLTACTQQHYYEGLKAGRRASCLEYPESEYKDCIEETDKSYDEYQGVRKEIIGN
jgi:hypothetical protein